MLGPPKVVPFDPDSAGLGIAGVEVEAMRAGDQGERLVDVGPKLVGGPGSTGISPGDGEAAADRLAEPFEADHVIALPAMERDRDPTEAFEGAIHVHAERLITLAGEGERLGDGRVGRDFHSARSFREVGPRSGG